MSAKEEQEGREENGKRKRGGLEEAIGRSVTDLSWPLCRI